MRKLTIFLVLIGFILSMACMQRTRVADLTVASTKNISTLEGAQDMGIFEGKDCMSAFSNQMPNQEEAMDRAMEAGGGNAMTDVVIYFKPANCIFDNKCWEVKGRVIRTKDLLADQNSVDEYLNSLDDTYVKEYLSTPSGHKYLLIKKRTSVELDHDKRHYDFVLKVN